MSETQASDNHCEHCGKSFIRATSLRRHSCDVQRRWNDRDTVSNRIAYLAWREFFQNNYPSKKNIEYRDFMNSSLYGAFVRWGNYCVEVRAINPSEFARHLIKNSIKIDNWCSDSSYTPYLIAYLRSENHLDAIHRSVTYMMNECESEGIRLDDYFRYINANKICSAITRGHVSPWMIYNCDSGIEFLGKLNADQIGVINDYIDPTVWGIRFKRYSDEVTEIRNLISAIGAL